MDNYIYWRSQAADWCDQCSWKVQRCLHRVWAYIMGERDTYRPAPTAPWSGLVTRQPSPPEEDFIDVVVQ